MAPSLTRVTRQEFCFSPGRNFRSFRESLGNFGETRFGRGQELEGETPNSTAPPPPVVDQACVCVVIREFLEEVAETASNWFVKLCTIELVTFRQKGCKRLMPPRERLYRYTISLSETWIKLRRSRLTFFSSLNPLTTVDAKMALGELALTIL